jgi:hypothetical protein
MRRIYTILLLLLVSLFILSANKFTCYNADLVGQSGEYDPLIGTYIEYIADTGNLILRTTGETPEIYSITTDMKTKDKIIKDRSITVGYAQVVDNVIVESDLVGWTVLNKEYFLNTYVPFYYPEDKERLEEWLSNPTRPGKDYFAEPVVLHSEDAILSEDPKDPNQFHVLSKAFFMGLSDDDGSGPRLILEIANLPIYDYDAIIEGDADPVTYVNFKNTVIIDQQVPNR